MAPPPSSSFLGPYSVACGRSSPPAHIHSPPLPPFPARQPPHHHCLAPRSSRYQDRPPLPFVPGSDYASVIDAVGPSVRRLRPGDCVYSWVAVGSFAELSVAEEDLKNSKFVQGHKKH